MRKYAALNVNHHVVRRCGYQVIERDDPTKQVIGLFPTAMMLRVGMAEDYLSVNWLEHCSGAKIDQLKAIIAIHRKKAVGRLSPDSGVAVSKVDTVLTIGK